MSKNTTNRLPRKVLKPQIVLTEAEAERIAEKLAVALEHRPDEIGLLLVLVNHLEHVRDDPGAFEDATFAVKRALFIGTPAADLAQEQFESRAMATRGTLLMWPSEKVA